LKVREEEGLIFLDRAANHAAKDVLNEDAALRSIVVARIESSIAKKLEDITMELVGSGLCDDVDLTAAEVTVFGIEVVRDNTKLGDGI
jgi:hypothetical protein